METVEPSSWPYVFGGLACLLAGLLLRSKARLNGLLALLGSGPASPGERQWLPLVLIFSGVAWLFMWLSMILPFTGGQRPFIVVMLTVALTPLAALAFLGTLVWVVFLRRIFA